MFSYTLAEYGMAFGAITAIYGLLVNFEIDPVSGLRIIAYGLQTVVNVGGVIMGMRGGGDGPTSGNVNGLNKFITFIENQTKMSDNLKKHLIEISKYIFENQNETARLKFIEGVTFDDTERAEMKNIMNDLMSKFSFTPSTATLTGNPINPINPINSRIGVSSGGIRRKYTSRGRKVHYKKQTRKH